MNDGLVRSTNRLFLVEGAGWRGVQERTAMRGAKEEGREDPQIGRGMDIVYEAQAEERFLLTMQATRWGQNRRRRQQASLAIFPVCDSTRPCAGPLVPMLPMAATPLVACRVSREERQDGVGRRPRSPTRLCMLARP